MLICVLVVVWIEGRWLFSWKACEVSAGDGIEGMLVLGAWICGLSLIPYRRHDINTFTDFIRCIGEEVDIVNQPGLGLCTLKRC